MTPEVLSRLRRLASSVSKSHVAQRKGESEKNGETNKEELENSTKQYEENDANSGNGSSTGNTKSNNLYVHKHSTDCIFSDDITELMR